jgi:hypothetical protein
MHATIFHKLILALISCLLLGCTAYDWPYYKPEVTGGIATRKDAVEIPIQENVSIWVATVCYPRYETETDKHPKGYQPCHIVIYRFGPPSTILHFEGSQFVVQDFNKPEIRYDAKVSESAHVSASPLRPGMDPGEGVFVDLKYEMPPKQFRLLMPALMIDGKPHKVLEILFTHTENTEWMPFLANW